MSDKSIQAWRIDRGGYIQSNLLYELPYLGKKMEVNYVKKMSNKRVSFWDFLSPRKQGMNYSVNLNCHLVGIYNEELQ